jgi:hypothetical protein
MSPRRSVAAVAALGLLIAISAVIGYGVGVVVGGGPRMSEVKAFRDVPAYSGDKQVSATVDGITYGVSGDVPWVDATGSWHEGGWPACVTPVSSIRLTFGGALIFGPTGTGNYRILWVDCRK